MTPRELTELLPCPFCGGSNLTLTHNTDLAITFIACGDDVGKGGCGLVASYRPHLQGMEAIAAWNLRQPSGEWVSVSERLPDNENPQIAYSKGTGRTLAWHCPHRGWFSAQYGMVPLPLITHWQPLPAAPAKDTDAALSAGGEGK